MCFPELISPLNRNRIHFKILSKHCTACELFLVVDLFRETVALCSISTKNILDLTTVALGALPLFINSLEFLRNPLKRSKGTPHSFWSGESAQIVTFILCHIDLWPDLRSPVVSGSH